MTKIPYKAPQFNESSYNCPFCNAFARQIWNDTYYILMGSGYRALPEIKMCTCSHCTKNSFWHNEIMIFPNFQGIEPANQDLIQEIQSDYLEAAEILLRSPRGAAALLRLSIQKLCIQLGEKGKDINTDIGNLVKRGLPAKVQESLDVLRVIGNEAVHPGEMDLRDDVEIASSLFRLVNFIAEKMITEPREIEEIYNKIPESKKEQISQRDKKVSE